MQRGAVPALVHFAGRRYSKLVSYLIEDPYMKAFVSAKALDKVIV
jgi:hypothetical protein